MLTRGRRTGRTSTSNRPLTNRNPASAHCAQVGRASSAPSKMLSISSAWISTPSSAEPPAMVRRSDRPSAVTPTSTSLRSNTSRGTVPGQHIGGRDEAGRRPAGVAEPHRAVGLRRYDERVDPDPLDPAVADLHGEPRHAGGDPEHLERQRGDHDATDHRDQRNPTHGAALGIGVEQAVAGRRVVDVRHASQRRVVAPEKRDGVAAHGPHRSHPAGRLRRGLGDTIHAGDGQHHRSSADRRRQHRVVARQPGELRREVGTDGADQRGQALRRQPIRLRHQDVEPDGGRVAGGDAIEE